MNPRPSTIKEDDEEYVAEKSDVSMKSAGDSEEEKPSQSRRSRRKGKRMITSSQDHDYKSNDSEESSDHASRSHRNLKASQRSKVTATKMSTRNKGSVS